MTMEPPPPEGMTVVSVPDAPTLTLTPGYASAVEVLYDDGAREPLELPPGASRVVFTFAGPEGAPRAAVFVAEFPESSLSARSTHQITLAFEAQVPHLPGTPPPPPGAPVRVTFGDGTVLDMAPATRCVDGVHLAWPDAVHASVLLSEEPMTWNPRGGAPEVLPAGAEVATVRDRVGGPSWALEPVVPLGARRFGRVYVELPNGSGLWRLGDVEPLDAALARTHAALQRARGAREGQWSADRAEREFALASVAAEMTFDLEPLGALFEDPQVPPVALRGAAAVVLHAARAVQARTAGGQAPWDPAEVAGVVEAARRAAREGHPVPSSQKSDLFRAAYKLELCLVREGQDR